MTTSRAMVPPRTGRPAGRPDTTKITTVIDAGARYGIHPSWSGFAGELRYFAFEPDKQEAARLRHRNCQPGFEVVDRALARDTGRRRLYITAHRGYCSFLQPDPDSQWFKRYRPGEGAIKSVQSVETCSIDEFAASRGLRIDFIKADAEGAELEVLEGARQQLASAVLGIRTTMYFQRCYKEQALFPSLDQYLRGQGYWLLNLDYFGRGVPRNSFFRNPDPLSPDTLRYGTLIGADGVWLKDYEQVCVRDGERSEALAYATLKYAYFCMLNHAPDVALDTLRQFVRSRKGRWSRTVEASGLYRALRRTCAEFLGRWRVYPDVQWEEARAMFLDIFGLQLRGGDRYWRFIQEL